MEQAAQLIEAISALLWPVVAVAVIAILFPAIRSVIISREFTLEIGGFKLSAQKATEKIQEQIADLQSKVAALEAETAPAAHAPQAPPSPPTSDDAAEPFPAAPQTTSPRPASLVMGANNRLQIVWVDDNPENNAFEAVAFRGEGHDVVQLKSSADVWPRLMAAPPADLVISDMGRFEGGARDPDAGIRLLREMRAQGHATAFAFYTSPSSISRHREEAEGLGAIVMTSSFVTLSAAIKRTFPNRTPAKEGVS